jgi:hypothetical protein
VPLLSNKLVECIGARVIIWTRLLSKADSDMSFSSEAGLRDELCYQIAVGPILKSRPPKALPRATGSYYELAVWMKRLSMG